MRVTPHPQTQQTTVPPRPRASKAPDQTQPRAGVTDCSRPVARTGGARPHHRASQPPSVRHTVSRSVAVVVLGAVVLSALTTDAAHASTQVLALATSVDQVFTNIRDWLVGILAGLATVFLTVGGVRYLLAGGNPGETEKAKGCFRNAAWGYGLAALAPLAVEILRGIVGA
ncbi:pilin [Amycolatopsis sp. cmx-11-12]|uniref:pilin n=1 Tax=Amycolatopsis sp. cmx-11-12 TaxID=2785795 RepID=UPI003917B722